MSGFCTQCGNPLREGDRFCRKCGTPVVDLMPEENPEGTVLIAGPESVPQAGPEVVSGEIKLSVDDVLNGARKVVDFGSGDRFALDIPAGMMPGDILVVRNTGITHPDTGAVCDIELKVTVK